MTQVKSYWQNLVKPGVTALVGAGGKTTVLTKLVEYGLFKGQKTLVTTTTKLYGTQVEQWNPYYGTDFEGGQAYAKDRIHAGKAAAWFSALEGGKAQALSTDTINHIAALNPGWQILVEADGAKEKWLKAPKQQEPVIPKCTSRTIGVINLAMLGQALDHDHVHNLEEVLAILGQEEGALMTPALMAQLILHPHGLFQYSAGEKVLFCTGYDVADSVSVHDLVSLLGDSFIESIILAEGYKVSCQIKKVIQCR